MKQLLAWAASLASFVNHVAFFVDFDGLEEATSFDFELCAISAFRNYYKLISFSTQSIFDNSAICYSRIAHYSRKLAEDTVYYS